MGYTLMAWRGLERWFLHWGKVRAGKGTIEDVRALLLRSPHAAMSCEPMRLTEGFEILQLKDARVAVLTEFGNLDNRAGLPVAGQVKRLVGRDPLHLKVKNGQPVTVKSQAAVVAMANEMPRLPNHGAGLSSKLVILPFLRSWEGKADSRIKDEYLPRELEGIAYRCALAAVRLVREPEVGKKFPVLKASQEALGVYTSEVSEADRFLGWAFEKGTGGVAFELVWGLYRQFCKAYSLAPKAGVKGLTRWLMRDGTWDLARKKTSHGVYVMGLRMKERPGLPEEDDELGSYGEECGEEFGGGEPE
jgi:phage/plasmid-associated DNA primase